MTAVRHSSRSSARSARSLVALVAAAIALLDATALAAQEGWPIDRWLVAVAAEAPGDIEADLLEAPGEAGILPDRGRAAGGVTWRLVRDDGAMVFALDSILDDPAPGTVAYAHTYLRLPSDRTLRLRWSVEECTRTAAWLNGRPLPDAGSTGGEIAARFGAGWNTLLLKLRAGDCPFDFSAALESDGETGEADGPRVQASRPYGDVRTGPEDWVVPSDTAHIAVERRWRGERLYAGLVVELTAWARAAVSDVELELRDGLEGRARAAWLVPAEPTSVVVPIQLDRLDRLRSTGDARLRLTWGDRESDHRVVVTGSRPAPSSPVVLDGWKVSRSAGDGADRRSSARLPNGTGWRLEGEWEVPEALAGHTLVLDVEGAPAEYVLNGSPARTSGNEITLCSPCSDGVELHLAVRSTGAWTSHPVVRATP